MIPVPMGLVLVFGREDAKIMFCKGRSQQALHLKILYVLGSLKRTPLLERLLYPLHKLNFLGPQFGH